MLMLSSKLYNLPILSLHSGSKIATAEKPLINPHNLKIVGWWCISPLSRSHMILLEEDVREVSNRGLIIDDNTTLSEPEELVKYKDVIDADFHLLHKLVKTKHKKLGKVSDFSFNEGMFVQKLYVNPPIISVLSKDASLIIDRTQILEVTDEYILVKDTDVKETSAVFAAEPATP